MHAFHLSELCMQCFMTSLSLFWNSLRLQLADLQRTTTSADESHAGTRVLSRIFLLGVRIVTSSSALLGCTPTTVSIIFLDTPIFTATAKPCRSSPACQQKAFPPVLARRFEEQASSLQVEAGTRTLSWHDRVVFHGEAGSSRSSDWACAGWHMAPGHEVFYHAMNTSQLDALCGP